MKLSGTRRLSQTIRITTLLFLLLGLVLNSVPVNGQTRRSGTRQPPPTAPKKKDQPSSADDKPTQGSGELLRSHKSEAMSLAFANGKLPDPLRAPAGSVDQRAAALAKSVSLGDESSTPALCAAILAAGIGIRDRDGSILQTVQPGQGLVFEAWEVAAMAKMYGEGRGVPLADLSQGLKSVPDLKDAAIDEILLKGIRTLADGNNAFMRFWARFIVELGRNQEKPYDILGTADAKAVQLDAIQAAFILRRLAGDLFTAGPKTAAGSRTRADTLFVNASLASSPSFTPVVARPRQRSFVSTPTHYPLNPSPCEGMGSDPIHDTLATEVTNVWGKFFGETKAGKFVGIANVVLAYAKFIATYAALETEITVANPPVIRTKNATPDRSGRRQLTAKVTMDVGKWDQINCFRHALNILTGMDFSLLDDGPIEGVEVNWHLDQGGAGSLYSGRTGITENRQFVGFVNDGPRIQDAGTYAGIPGRGGVPVGNATRGKTDKEGTTRVFLEGSPKVPYVSPPVVPVMKQAVVRTTIRMKGGDIKGDAADLWGQLRGGVGGLVTLPLELLYRTDWASTATLVVPVRDHEQCEGGWNGEVTMQEESWQPPKQMIQVNGHSYSEIFDITASKGMASGSFKAMYREEGRAQVANACTQFRRITTTGTAERAAKFSVVMTEGSEDYTVWVTAPSFPAKVENEVSACGYGNREDRGWTEETTAGGFSTGLEGKLDPNNPGVLSGSKEIPGTHGSRKITWELRRCQ